MLKILLAIDGSEQSESAVDEITRRCFPPDSDVRIISVVEEPAAYFPGAFPGDGVNMNFSVEIEKAARERARVAVEKAAAKLRSDEKVRGFNLSTKVISGSPKQSILDEAEAFGADLIVVGSHGHGMVGRFLLGSVSQAVA